jgi:hypothetical protein
VVQRVNGVIVENLRSHFLIELIFFNWYSGWRVVELGPLATAATNRPIVPAPGDYDDGEIGGMMIGRGNRSARRKPAPVLLCPSQTRHTARTRTRAATAGSQRLIAWATARPSHFLKLSSLLIDRPELNYRVSIPGRYSYLFSPLHRLWGSPNQLFKIRPSSKAAGE